MASVVGPKSVMHAFLLLFLMQSSMLVGAVDITFYDSRTGCSGTGIACNGISSSTCCVTSLSGSSVSVIATSGAACLGAEYFSYGTCRTGSYVGTTYGNFCYYNGRFTGAYWFNACNRRRSLLGDHESTTLATCTGQTKPNAVVFTEDGTKGHWVLSSSDVVEMYTQLTNVNEADKLDWIKAKGASYRELDSTMLLGTQELKN